MEVVPIKNWLNILWDMACEHLRITVGIFLGVCILLYIITSYVKSKMTPDKIIVDNVENKSS